MTFWSATDWALLAQEAPQGQSPLLLFAPVVVMVVLYFLIVQRPQSRERGERQAMLDGLKKNDHVLLSCGIFGVVTNIRPDADEVTVRVDESSNAKLRVTRSSIARVIVDEPAAKAEATTGG